MYFIDSRMGVSGDMLLGAFIDLDIIIDIVEVIEVLESAGNAMGKTTVNIVEKKSGAIKGTGLMIGHEKFSHVSGIEMQEHLENGIGAVGLAAGRVLARKILDAILQAEIRVHNSTPDEIHLHETGSPDTLVDIIGIAFFHEKMGLANEIIQGTPISVGQGQVRIAHGTVNVPAPATAEILQSSGLEFISGPHDGEMATPTGAAVLANILQSQAEEPDFEPDNTGIGFGTRVFDGNPGYLRVLAGR